MGHRAVQSARDPKQRQASALPAVSASAVPSMKPAQRNGTQHLTLACPRGIMAFPGSPNTMHAKRTRRIRRIAGLTAGCFHAAVQSALGTATASVGLAPLAMNNAALEEDIPDVSAAPERHDYPASSTKLSHQRVAQLNSVDDNNDEGVGEFSLQIFLNPERTPESPKQPTKSTTTGATRVTPYTTVYVKEEEPAAALPSPPPPPPSSSAAATTNEVAHSAPSCTVTPQPPPPAATAVTPALRSKSVLNPARCSGHHCITTTSAPDVIYISSPGSEDVITTTTTTTTITTTSATPPPLTAPPAAATPAQTESCGGTAPCIQQQEPLQLPSLDKPVTPKPSPPVITVSGAQPAGPIPCGSPHKHFNFTVTEVPPHTSLCTAGAVNPVNWTKTTGLLPTCVSTPIFYTANVHGYATGCGFGSALATGYVNRRQPHTCSAAKMLPLNVELSNTPNSKEKKTGLPSSPKKFYYPVHYVFHDRATVKLRYRHKPRAPHQREHKHCKVKPRKSRHQKKDRRQTVSFGSL